ncbi:MAG: hypothetical protein ACM3ZU_08105 [Bacteroidota bacterium]
MVSVGEQSESLTVAGRRIQTLRVASSVRLLEEALYYSVREDFNCSRDPAYRESDGKILPALELLAATAEPPDNPYVCPASIDAFCRALHRRGRLEDLKRIPWSTLEIPAELKLFDV